MIRDEFTRYVQDRLHRYRHKLQHMQSTATAYPNEEHDADMRELQARISELEHVLGRLASVSEKGEV